MSQTHFGKYRLVRHLADGGMATIWLAEQTGPEGFTKELVIKRLLPKLARDSLFTQMFLDEARLASKLSHPNIGQILELGQLDGAYFIAMEFVDGLSLEQVIEAYSDHGPMLPDLAARVIVDVLKALDHAHGATDRSGESLGVVHRDVTPSNVLVSVDGIVKLVDFGVAKAVKHHTKTQTGAVKGKYAYMSPEQVRDENVGPESDLFSVGITFFELLTGVKPFGKELPAVSRILREESPDPREFEPSVPELYAQIIARALTKSADDRYASAQAMLLDLETALRMRNSYVSNRELSVLVRKLRGLPIPKRDDSIEFDGALFTADRSAENLQVRPTGSKKPPLIVIALSVFSVLVAAMLGALLISSRPGVAPGTLFVLSEEVPAEPGSQPEALYIREGNPVVVETTPEATVFHRGIFIGTTPFQTTLTPGKYRVEFVSGDTYKEATLSVDEGDVFTRFRRDLSSLDNAPGDAPVKPERLPPKVLKGLDDFLKKKSQEKSQN